MKIQDINLDDYDYDLPDDRIARYPVSERDMSQILVNKGNLLSKDLFKNIDHYIPSDSLLVFNNSRVIKARIMFMKESGASVEILCLEPLSPQDYEQSLSSLKPVEWKCIIGNLKKWKHGKIATTFTINGYSYILTAERLNPENEAWRIRFEWSHKNLSFGEVIEATGHVPLPPYLNREDEPEDIKRYQTVYSRIKGSVAAPTAGLHFTNHVLEKIKNKGIKTAELTLHVGAGTFQPIKSNHISGHEMHREHFFISRETIELLAQNHEKIISVGTTSVRTLESLYWLGVKSIKDPESCKYALTLGQWEPYQMDSEVSITESMEALLYYAKDNSGSGLHASTSIFIVPGYQFRMIKGIVTNFHQPRSTLLLLISAWAGKNWIDIYKYALENEFRFLSYGDSSLLLKQEQ